MMGIEAGAGVTVICGVKREWVSTCCSKRKVVLYTGRRIVMMTKMENWMMLIQAVPGVKVICGVQKFYYSRNDHNAMMT